MTRWRSALQWIPPIEAGPDAYLLHVLQTERDLFCEMLEMDGNGESGLWMRKAWRVRLAWLNAEIARRLR